jgi:hypothetical protein
MAGDPGNPVEGRSRGVSFTIHPFSHINWKEFLPHPIDNFRNYKEKTADEVRDFVDTSPLIDHSLVTPFVRGRIEQSVTDAARYLVFGRIFDGVWDFWLICSLLYGLISFVSYGVYLLKMRDDSPVALLCGFVTFLAVFWIVGLILAKVPFFRSASWGSFWGLIFVALFFICARLTWGMSEPNNGPLFAEIPAAMAGSAAWTAMYLGTACVLSIFAAMRIRLMRALIPCEDIIDLLYKATVNAGHWEEARAALSDVHGQMGPEEIRHQTRRLDESRSGLLWQLESIACRIETDLVRAQLGRQNRGTTTWIREEAGKRAAYVRGLKMGIVLPDAMEAAPAADDAPLSKKLGALLVEAASGNWGAFPKADVRPTPPQSPWVMTLRALATIVLPLCVILTLVLLEYIDRTPPWLSHLPVTGIITVLAALSASELMKLINPEVGKDLASVNDVLKFFSKS